MSFLELDRDLPKHATHILDGKLLQQKTDAAGRFYYIDMATGQRAKTAGRSPEPLEESAVEITDTDFHHMRMDDDGAPPQREIHEESAFLQPLEAEGGCAHENRSEVSEPAHATCAVVPTTLPVEIYALAVSALASLFGRVDMGRYSAQKRNNQEVILTLPGTDGDERILITLPEAVSIRAVAYNGEDN